MKILVPVDGSEYSLKAVESACDLAKAQPFSSMILMSVGIELPELEEGRYIADKMKAQAEAALAKAKEVGRGKGPASRPRWSWRPELPRRRRSSRWPRKKRSTSSSSAAGGWPVRPRPSWGAPLPRW